MRGVPEIQLRCCGAQRSVWSTSSIVNGVVSYPYIGGNGSLIMGGRTPRITSAGTCINRMASETMYSVFVVNGRGCQGLGGGPLVCVN